MRSRKTRVGLAAAAVSAAFTVFAAGPPGTERDTGSTMLRPPVAIDTQAMKAMLRADRDKDGTLNREELEHYDMTLGPRFSSVDGDRDGRLTLYEFETLLEDPQQTSASRR